jgi:serine/threonine-protein kinase
MATSGDRRSGPGGKKAGPGRYSQVLARPKRASAGRGSAPGEPKADPMIGRLLDGRYRIDEVLGAGGVGVVYKAMHVHLNSPVAIKVLNERFGGSDELRSRFEREARAQHKLKHPHIVALTDYGVADDVPYLTMELLEGQSLSSWLRQEGPPHPEDAVEIMRQVLRGLAFAHAQGVVHRDLKPANVFLVPLPDAPRYVKLLDFGLAKMLDPDEHDPATRRGDPTLTKIGAVLGTPAYMSPEQASGGEVDPRSDVYSAGVMLFELLTGRQPFPTKDRAAQLRAHLVDPVPALTEVRPELRPSAALVAFLDRALAKDRGVRYPDAAAMLAALDELPRPVGDVAGESGPAPRAAAQGGVGAPGAPEPGVPTRVDPARGTTGKDGEAPGSRPTPPRPAAPRVRFESAAPTRPRSRGGRGRVLWVGLLLLGLVAVFGWFGEPPLGGWLAPAGAPEKDAETGRPEGSQAATGGGREGSGRAATAAPEVERPPPRDPLSDGPGEGLASFARQVARGGRPSRQALRRVARLQSDREDDPRPSLLLGRAFFERGWQSDAIERYVLAYRIDPSSRGDEAMQAHLLDLAGKPPPVGQRAADAILEVYGGELLEEVERASGRGSGSERARYRALAARLR